MAREISIYSAFCPHNGFMCSLWFSEWTVIISLYIIRWFVLLMASQYNFCPVRVKFYICSLLILVFKLKRWTCKLCFLENRGTTRKADSFIVLFLKCFKYFAGFPNNTLHSRDNSHTSFEFSSRSSARHITKHVFRRPSIVKTSSTWSAQKLPTVLRDCELSTLSLLFSRILIRMKS